MKIRNIEIKGGNHALLIVNLFNFRSVSFSLVGLCCTKCVLEKFCIRISVGLIIACVYVTPFQI